MSETDAPAVDQEMYKRKYTLLTHKYKYIHLNNCKLRNRVYRVKKEIRYLKRLKRILIAQLSRHKDAFMTACLEIPDSEPGSNVEDLIAKVAESAGDGNGAKKKKALAAGQGGSVQASPVAAVCPKEELRILAQISAFAYDEAKASVAHIIDAVIQESRAERKAREEAGLSVPSTPGAGPSPNPSETAQAAEVSLSGEELLLLGGGAATDGDEDETDCTDLQDTDVGERE